MRNLLFLLLFLAATPEAGAQALPASPRQLYPGLFEAVQLGRVYPDGKTFVDALPKNPPADIMAAYQQQHAQPAFDLKAFAQQYFLAPTAATDAYHSNVATGVRPHLDTLWTVLQRRPDAAAAPGSSLLPLPRPYLVPGGRFREVYYWDSYFTMLGLVDAHRVPLVRDMVDNFAYLIGRYGFIPNGNRTYYLTRSQPPFFSRMVELLARAQGDSVRRRYQRPLLREYAYWMHGAEKLRPGTAAGPAVRLPAGEVLNRYWDASDQPREESYAEDVAAAKLTKQPLSVFYRNVRAAAASGWDFSSRWFGPAGTLATIQTTNLVPVDLNCLLYGLEQSIARGYAQQGQPAQAKAFWQKATRRRQALLRYCWDARTGWFDDYNWRQHTRSPRRTLAGVYPLTLGLATPAQAKRVAAGLQREFLRPGGLVTTPLRTGQQWDAPNAWAPLQWMAIAGLTRYGQPTLARTVAERWAGLNVRVFAQTGKLLEKYDVVNPNAKAGGGEYPLQDGFGWTNGVLSG
ncbi:MAG: alpha,alpha-trehalase TreA [Hymenobacter sp.]